MTSPTKKSDPITKVQVSVPQFIFNAKEMDVYVTLHTDQDEFAGSALIHIPPDVYKDWGTDDNHILDYVLQELKKMSSKT